jgi:hypothetical protein
MAHARADGARHSRLPGSCRRNGILRDVGRRFVAMKLGQQNHSRTWVKEDEVILRTMLANGESVARIALKLKRTRQAIVARAARLHLKWSEVETGENIRPATNSPNST